MIARLLGLGLGFNAVNVGIAALVIAFVAGAAGFAGGWTVQGWRLGAKVERLTGENATLRAANDRCATDVAAVQKSVKAVVDKGLRLAEQARKGMERAADAARTHAERADEILSQPPVPPAEWCAAIQKEQADYVAKRRASRSDKPLLDKGKRP